MAISNDILSSTLRVLAKEAVDQLFVSTPLLEAIKAKGGIETIDGGSKIQRPLILAEHSSITQLSSGYEPINLAVSDVLRTAEFNWCDFIAPIVITKKEELSNRGPRAILSIAEARLKSVMGMLKREWEKQSVKADSSVLSEMLSLDGKNLATGFLYPAASVTASVGGLAKNVFTELNNQYFDANGVANLDVGDMAQLYINCQINSPSGVPNLILASNDSYVAYKKLLFANERFVNETTLDGGKLALAFHSAMMHVSPNMPAGTSGTEQISMYFLNTEHIKCVFDSDANFTMSDFENVSGYASRSANIICRTQLIFDHLKSQGVLANAS
tara:strand:+ start:3740 stop:4726 length:987 start_codon:yes stop_codon:yes gene_type:complete